MGLGEKEGYLIIVADKQKYLESAVNLALSLKLKDKKPVCLLCCSKIRIPSIYSGIFDKMILIKESEKLIGTTNKLLQYKYSPFDRTMFIDSDCLMIKDNIDIIWKKLKSYNIGLRGTIASSGKWSYFTEENNVDIGTIVTLLNIKFLIKANSQVMYYDKSSRSEEFFKKALYLYEHFRDKVSLQFKKVKDEYTDEPIFGAAMGYFNIKPFPFMFKRHFFDCVQWSSTIQDAEDYSIDILRGICKVKFKGINRYDSPIIAHFGGLRPTEIYFSEVNKLRELYKLPPAC